MINVFAEFLSSAARVDTFGKRRLHDLPAVRARQKGRWRADPHWRDDPESF